MLGLYVLKLTFFLIFSSFTVSSKELEAYCTTVFSRRESKHQPGAKTENVNINTSLRGGLSVFTESRLTQWVVLLLPRGELGVSDMSYHQGQAA